VLARRPILTKHFDEERVMTSRPSVAIIGLGLMGRPMARTLIRAGFDVHGWNRSRVAEALAAGIPLARTLDDVARAEICLMMLADSAAVDSVLPNLEPHLQAGHLVLDMGSSDPFRSRAHAAQLASRHIGWVDAPVSGGPEGAAAGTLAIMAGGTPEDFARAQPVLEALGSVTHVGGPGTGHAVKTINQLIVGLTIEAVAEALTLAEKSGLDPRLVQQALRGGFADSRVLQIHGTRMIERAYVPGGRAAIQLKDLRLALNLASRAGVRLPHLESVTERYECLVAGGDGDLDQSALHRLLWSSGGA
jgi:3-hydroxyisobutyrate dehydrogenase-like beta-hydroxyacid dehydrogenase